MIVLRYIHQTPVKAGIVGDAQEYKWSSYNVYIENKGLTDREYVLKMFHNDNGLAIKAFIEYTNEQIN